MADNINQTLVELTDEIDDFTISSGECCQAKGSMVDVGGSNGVITVGPGEQFPDQQSYFDAKCNVANALWDTEKGFIDWLKTNGVDAKLGLLGGVTTAVALGLTLAGPVGWAIALVEIVVVSLVTFLFVNIFDFEDMQDALTNKHEELVKGLYNASDTSGARASFMSILGGATPTLTAIELQLVQLTLTSSFLNQLFAPRSDVANWQSPVAIDCGASPLKVWTFPTDLESWTFADLSTGGSSASAAWNASAQAIENTLTTLSLPNVTAEGKNSSPTVSIPVTPANSVRVDFSAPSDAPKNTRIEVVANYTDMTSESNDVVFNEAGTLVLALGQSKTIGSIDVHTQRSTSGSALGSVHTVNILEVRIQ